MACSCCKPPALLKSPADWVLAALLVVLGIIPGLPGLLCLAFALGRWVRRWRLILVCGMAIGWRWASPPGPTP